MTVYQTILLGPVIKAILPGQVTNGLKHRLNSYEYAKPQECTKSKSELDQPDSNREGPCVSCRSPLGGGAVAHIAKGRKRSRATGGRGNLLVLSFPGLQPQLYKPVDRQSAVGKYRIPNSISPSGSCLQFSTVGVKPSRGF